MEYFKIGKIVGTHGVAGKIVIRHSLGKRTSLEDTEAIFIEEEPDQFMPWFLSVANAKSADEVFVELDGIHSPEASRPLLKKEVWITESDFKRLAATSSAISLLGYSVVDKNENLGPILEVIEQPHQTLCRILLGEKEAWIPVNEVFLKRIDRTKKQVLVDLPDGLLDVYRS